MLKKMFSLLLSSILAFSVLSGCGKADTGKNTPSPSASTETKAPAKNATLTFWFVSKGGEHDKYFNEVGEKFNKQYPNIKVNTTALPGTVAEIETKLNAAELSGTSPDVLSGFVVLAGSRGTRGQFLELDSYINSWKDKDDLFDSVYNVGKVNGKIIGIPYFPEPHLLAYRKDFFKEAGLDPNKPPKNWSELAQYAEKLTVRDKDGNVTRAGFDIPTSQPNSNFFEAFMRQNGSKVNDLEKGVPAFDDKASVEALQFIVNLYDKKVSLPYNFSKAETIPFFNEKAAMSIVQNSQLNNILTTKPELKDKIALAPVLEQKQKACFTGYTLFYIDAKTKNKDESWEFVKFLCSSDSMKERYERLNIPVVRKSLSDWMIQKNPAFGPILMEGVKYGSGRDSLSWATIENKYLAVTAYEEALNHVKTPEQALKDGMKGLQEEISRMKK